MFCDQAIEHCVRIRAIEANLTQEKIMEKIKTADNKQQTEAWIPSESNLLTAEEIEGLFAEMQSNERQGGYVSPPCHVRRTWDAEFMESEIPSELNLLTTEEIEGLFA